LTLKRAISEEYNKRLSLLRNNGPVVDILILRVIFSRIFLGKPLFNLGLFYTLTRLPFFPEMQKPIMGMIFRI